MLTSYQRAGHSADVKMHLVLDGKPLPIAQLGSDFLILREPINHPPANAVLFFSIDGNERVREVRLPDGISVGVEKVLIATAQATAAREGA